MPSDMVCEECKQADASVHIQKKSSTASETHHYCEACADRLGFSGIVPPFLKKRPDDDFLVGIVRTVLGDFATVEVLTSSMFSRGELVRVRAIKRLHQEGAEIGISGTREEMRSITSSANPS
jgi:hypothetical protein